jgi:hypothetical protein
MPQTGQIPHSTGNRRYENAELSLRGLARKKGSVLRSAKDDMHSKSGQIHSVYV